MLKSIITLPILFCLGLALLVGCKEDDENYEFITPTGPTRIGDSTESILQFEGRLENIRKDLNIPGMSASIVKNRQLVWAKGFGYADVNGKIPARPTTSYHLASLTKTFAAIIVMQLVEDDLLGLDNPVSNYGINIEGPGIVRVKHLLTHTSEGIPGEEYKYNGSRFSLLDNVIKIASGKTFCELLVDRIVIPLELKNTAPNVLSDDCFLSWEERIDFAWNLAQGYTSSGAIELAYPSYFGTAAGLISSVVDMATYSIAIDQGMFLTEESWEQVFSPAISTNGDTLAYGLGWFVDQQQGVKILWHYGWWDAISALIIKVPSEETDFIIMANSDMLSRGSNNIGIDGDVMRSVVAGEFLHTFIF